MIDKIEYSDIDSSTEEEPSKPCLNHYCILILLWTITVAALMCALPTINFNIAKDLGIIKCKTIPIILVPIFVSICLISGFAYIFTLENKTCSSSYNSSFQLVACIVMISLIIFVILEPFYGNTLLLPMQNNQSVICREAPFNYNIILAFVISNSPTNSIKDKDFEDVINECPQIYKVFNLDPNKSINFTIAPHESGFLEKCTESISITQIGMIGSIFYILSSIVVTIFIVFHAAMKGIFNCNYSNLS